LKAENEGGDESDVEAERCRLGEPVGTHMRAGARGWGIFTVGRLGCTSGKRKGGMEDTDLIPRGGVFCALEGGT
jgi:hypothetical protein